MQNDAQHRQDSRMTSLPALAPRGSLSRPDSQHTSTPVAETTSPAEGSRRGRTSYRSKQGCRTCRLRKVKCDEQRPRCGPCTRLDKECDWEQNWKWNHATTNTQRRNLNVLTSGNAVWDPNVRSPSSPSVSSYLRDNLPAFPNLTNDEERERKAETTLPGTYNVVVTPESFADLPEYALATTSTRSSQSSSRASRMRIDTNTVVLDRFEESAPTSAISAPSPRRASLPTLSHPVVTPISSAPRSATFPPAPSGMSSDHRFMWCFRHEVAFRLVPRALDPLAGAAEVVDPIRSVFETESTLFPPLRDAMQAVGALHLYYAGQVRSVDHQEQYTKALSSLTSSEHNPTANGIFLQHFLLYIYDLSTEHGHEMQGPIMWELQLSQLVNIILARTARTNPEPFGYLLWLICRLDIEATLLGQPSCKILPRLSSADMLPPLEQLVPFSLYSPGLPSAHLGELRAVLELASTVIFKIGTIASIATECRKLVEEQGSSATLQAHCQDIAYEQEQEINTAWANQCPPMLAAGGAFAMSLQLVPPLQSIFQSTLALYLAAIIYLRTSMFPGQQLFLLTRQDDTDIRDTELKVDTILLLATSLIEAGRFDERFIILPVFLAGIATRRPDSKVRALDLIRAFEASGIGHNTVRTRKLLAAVYEEQSMAMSHERCPEHVEWLIVAAQRGLGISNCGL